MHYEAVLLRTSRVSCRVENCHLREGYVPYDTTEPQKCCCSKILLQLPACDGMSLRIYQSMHMCLGRVWQPIHVVAALQHRDHRQFAATHGGELPSDPFKVVVAELQGGHRVILMSVESCADEDRLRLERVDLRQQIVLPRRTKFSRATALRKICG
jgi:hypothetical protein